MALDMQALATRSPHVWHVTTCGNLARIESTRTLESAASLMRAAGDETWLRRRRPQSVPLRIGGDVVWLRDQTPLHPGNILFEGGWTFEHLIEQINARVYFWPGDGNGPIRAAGVNFESFRSRGDYVTLRLPLDAVRKQCRPFQLELCGCNVGAPRTVNGRKAARGPRTFVAPGAFALGVSKVHEITVRDGVDLDPIWDQIWIA